MSGFLLLSVCPESKIEIPTISWESVMVLRGMAQMHVDDLAERFKKLVVEQAGNADIQFAWVVFYQGRMFGAYSTAELALEKITDIEHCISIDEAPVPQASIN